LGKKVLYVIIGFVLLILVVLTAYSLFVSAPVPGQRTPGIAIIRIDGVITATPAAGILSQGMASAPRITSLIDRAARDDRVRGLLLVVNSPGGGAAASQEIYRELELFKETGKPIVVSMGETAASGGYYVSAPADYIFANPATVTGSIGAIMELFDTSELMDMLGIDIKTLKAGELKDAGSFSRAMTESEEEYLQAMVDAIHEQFLEDVLKARPLEEEVVEKISDARIVLGSEALELGMVDYLGNSNDARRYLAEKLGLPEAPPVIILEEKTFFERLIGLNLDGLPRLEEMLFPLYNYGVRLLY